MKIQLRPIREDELDMVRVIARDPAYAPGNWYGFRPVAGLAKEFAENGFLGEDVGRLAVEVDGEAAGIVSYLKGRYSVRGDWYDIGIALKPEFRGRGIGWRAQAMVTDYVFAHWPVERVQAATQPENIAEQKALLKAGFQLEGVVRAAEFRAGAWRDSLLYSRLRHDPAPEY
ncbi:GNAT family N-acetyltransferase [Actinoplanes sp. CA-030573]|uniref:GNAT family N-acetyltransferase n=1 Tax=Actinoplanes sp. CA-030573 TaxID=3239898 RepID=UPI003D9281CB